MSGLLTVVADNAPQRETEGPDEPLNARIRRLQAEARGMAREHITQLDAALRESMRLAGEIADGGDAYPVGVREMARTMLAESESRLLSLESLLARIEKGGDIH